MRGEIEGTEIYLSEDELPAFTFSVDSLTDPGRARSIRSTSIKIIATKEAKRALGNESMSMLEGEERPILKLTEGGTEVFRSEVVPLEYDRDVIECVAIGGGSTWFDIAKRINLRERIWATGPLATRSNVASSWFDTLDSFVYWPLVDFGAFSRFPPGVPPAQEPIAFSQLRPAIRIGRMITEVLSDNDWTLVPAGARAIRDWHRYIHLGNTKEAKVVSTSGGGIALNVFDPSTLQYSYELDGTEPQPIQFDEVDMTDYTGWSFGSFHYTTQDDGFVYPSYDLLMPFPAQDQYMGRTLRVVLWDLTDGVELTGATLGVIPDEDPAVAGTISGEGTLPEVFVPSGHIIYLGVTIDEAVTGTVNISNDNQARIDLITDYRELGYVILGSIMPSGTLANSMLNIAKAQSLLYVTDYDQKLIQVWATEDYYRTPENTTQLRDWSTRMDHSIAPVKKREAFPRTIELSYTRDEGDFEVSRLYRITDDKYATAYVNIEQGFADHKSIVVPYAATAMAPTWDLLIPKIVRLDSDLGSDNYDIAPRLLIADGVSTGAWQMATNSTPTNYPYYPKCYFISDDMNDVPMAFDNPTVYGNRPPTLKDNQWKFTLDTMRFGRTLEAYLMIHDHELLNFDHGMPTLVDDGSGPAWYYVQEISNHKFGKGVPTKCKLVPIRSPEVSLPAIVNPAFEVEVLPFVCAGPGYGSFTIGAVTTFGTVRTSTGFVATRSAGGVITVHGNGAPGALQTVTVPAAGSYCMWACNLTGEKSGDLDYIFNTNRNVTALNVDGYAALELISFSDEAVFGGIDLSNNPLLSTVVFNTWNGISLDLSANPLLSYVEVNGTGVTDVIMPNTDAMLVIYIRDSALTVSSVNAILTGALANSPFISEIDLSGGTSAAPTGAGLLAKADLITAGVTVTTN